MNDTDRPRLDHILFQIERHTEGGRSEFDAADMIQDAVLRCLSVIGEAASAPHPRHRSHPFHLCRRICREACAIASSTSTGESMVTSCGRPSSESFRT